MEILLVSFLMYVIFMSPLPHSIEFRHSSSPFCKNHKKPKVDKKILTCETRLHWLRDLYFPRTDAQNSQYIVN